MLTYKQLRPFIKRNNKFVKNTYYQSRNTKFQKILVGNQTEAERIFGKYLQNKLVKFIPQKSFLKPYSRIIDFYLPKILVGFEIDGQSHNGKEKEEYIKDFSFFKTRGIIIHRIKNEDVYSGKFREFIDFIVKGGSVGKYE